jgi:hypothetical protein
VAQRGAGRRAGTHKPAESVLALPTDFMQGEISHFPKHGRVGIDTIKMIH